MAATDDRLTPAQFGERFFAHAITEARLQAAVSGLAGGAIAFGPLGAGPGRLAKVTAKGRIDQPSVRRREGPEHVFDLHVPVALDLTIDLNVDTHVFHAAVTIALTLTARAAPPLRIVVDVDPPTRHDVTVVVEAESMRGQLLQRVAGIDDEIARFVAKYVAKELEKPQIAAARDIDVAAQIDRAYAPA